MWRCKKLCKQLATTTVNHSIPSTIRFGSCENPMIINILNDSYAQHSVNVQCSDSGKIEYKFKPLNAQKNDQKTEEKKRQTVINLK